MESERLNIKVECGLQHAVLVGNLPPVAGAVHECAGSPIVEAVAMTHGGDVAGAGGVVPPTAAVRLQEGAQLTVAARREPSSAPQGPWHPEHLGVLRSSHVKHVIKWTHTRIEQCLIPFFDSINYVKFV